MFGELKCYLIQMWFYLAFYFSFIPPAEVVMHALPVYM